MALSIRIHETFHRAKTTGGRNHPLERRLKSWRTWPEEFLSSLVWTALTAISFALPPHSPDGFLFCRCQREKLATYSADACVIIIEDPLITVLITHMCHVRRLTPIQVGPYMLNVTFSVTSMAGRFPFAKIGAQVNNVILQKRRSVVDVHRTSTNSASRYLLQKVHTLRKSGQKTKLTRTAGKVLRDFSPSSSWTLSDARRHQNPPPHALDLNDTTSERMFSRLIGEVLNQNRGNNNRRA